MIPADADVIVAGAGPVGLVAALRLARAGVRVLLLEKRAGLSTASLASTIHPPTLAVLHDLGVLDAVVGFGHPVTTIQYRTPDAVFAEFHMQDLAPETPFPYRLHLEQSRITPVLLARLLALSNAAVAFDRPVLAVHQDAGGVTVELPGGATARASFMLAADGARSAVRQALGIGFPGEDYPDKILRLLTTDDLHAVLPGLAPLTYLYNGAHSISVLRMPTCWRIILRVPADVPEHEAMDPNWILSRFRAVLPTLARLPSLAGTDIYRASRRLAERFHAGRVALIGDAAHVTSTRGGMNMNCGIYDATALADAITAGLGVAAAAEGRRRVAAEKLIPRTDRTVSGGAAWADTLRDTARSPAAALAYLRSAAMLDMAHA